MERSYPSLDGRYLVTFDVTEMRMSHWVERPVLMEPATGEVIFSLGDTLWHADTVTWSDDSRAATFTIRRYPGDAPNLTLVVYPEARKAEVRKERSGPTLHACTLRDLNQWLEAWYHKNRSH